MLHFEKLTQKDSHYKWTLNILMLLSWLKLHRKHSWVVWGCACSNENLTKQHFYLRVWRAEAVEIQIRKLLIQTSSVDTISSSLSLFLLKFGIFKGQEEGGVVMVMLWKPVWLITSKEAMSGKSVVKCIS